jgi:hypothetical protein
MHVRALSLGLAVALAGCRPAPRSDEPVTVEPASVPAAAAVEPDAIHQPIEDDRAAFHYEPHPLPADHEDDYEIWGGVTSGSVVDDSYGIGFGRPRSWGPPPEHRTFDSLPAERDALEFELEWAAENIEDCKRHERRWSRRKRELEARTPVDEGELARVEEKLRRSRSCLELHLDNQTRYRARIDEIDDELRRRRKMIEAGQCPAEPCPPGTVPPKTNSDMKRH